MAKVLGIGGVFFRSKDPEALGAWYNDWLGIPVEHPHARAREGGAEIVGDVESYEYGSFGWFLDPDGNKVELWQPPAGAAKAEEV
jgi:predicted enzyme related to lactoylglutathione lyase